MTIVSSQMRVNELTTFFGALSSLQREYLDKALMSKALQERHLGKSQDQDPDQNPTEDPARTKEEYLTMKGMDQEEVKR